MSFPASPVNGQQVTLGGVIYEFDSATSAWVRRQQLYSLGNLTVTGNLTSGNVLSSGYYFANGAPFTSSNYGNTNVAAYLGSYFTYANANAATQATAIDSINANLGAYETWANATFSVSTYGNSNVAGYLAGNVTIGNVSATAYYFANGTPFTSSSYGNTQVAAYLPTYTGNISAGNVTVAGNIVGGGVRYTASATPPSTPTVGDTWYDTSTDILFRYIDDGTNKYWIDVSTSTVSPTGGGGVSAAITYTYGLING